MDIKETNIPEITQIALNTPGMGGREGVTLNYVSPPATRKTTELQATCAKLGYPMVTIMASNMDPTDISGLPVPTVDPDTGDVVTRTAPPKWAKDLEVGKVKGPSVVFFDEFSNATGAVQAACLRVIFEGVVGEIVLDPKVRFIVAMNPPEESPNGFPLSPPMANRLCHVQVHDPPLAQWGAWMMRKAGMDDKRIKEHVGEVQLDLDALEVKTFKSVKKVWPEHFQKAISIVYRFLRQKPTYIRDQPDVHDPRSGGAWASPRSWDIATRLLASSWIHNCTNTVRLQLMGGCVGDDIALELMSFAINQDLPTPEEVLADPENFNIDWNRPDIVRNIMKTCILHVAPVMVINKETKENQKAAALEAVKHDLVDALWIVLSRIAHVAPQELLQYWKHLSPVKAYNQRGMKVMADLSEQIKKARNGS